MVERLYCERWSSDDGLAALIVTPTRELALQIFEVVRIVGKKHLFSAGLVTGGKKEFDEEQARIVKMNILGHFWLFTFLSCYQDCRII